MTLIEKKDHSIEIEYASFDGDTLEELEVVVHHPDGCDSTNCPIFYLEENIGISEALGLTYFGRRDGQWNYFFEEQASDLVDCAFRAGSLTVPIEFTFRTGYDSFTGEYDEELSWTPS